MKLKVVFRLEMVRRMPIWIGFAVPDACEYFQDAPDAGSSDFRKMSKTRKLLFLRENGFLINYVFITLKRQTAQTKMTARTMRRYHVFIKISLCDGFFKSNSCFRWKRAFSFFCMVNSFHQEIMFSLEIAEAGGSYFNQKNHQSVQPPSPPCFATCFVSGFGSVLQNGSPRTPPSLPLTAGFQKKTKKHGH